MSKMIVEHNSFKYNYYIDNISAWKDWPHEEYCNNIEPKVDIVNRSMKTYAVTL